MEYLRHWIDSLPLAICCFFMSGVLFLPAAKPAAGLQAAFLLLLHGSYQFLDIVQFYKLFEYSLHSVLSSLALLRNSELAVVLAVVFVIF